MRRELVVVCLCLFVCLSGTGSRSCGAQGESCVVHCVQCTVCSALCVVRGVWCVVCSVWCVVCGVWGCTLCWFSVADTTIADCRGLAPVLRSDHERGGKTRRR